MLPMGRSICYIGDAHNVHVKRWTAYFSSRGYDISLITHGGFYDPEVGWIYPEGSLDFYKNMNNVKLHFVEKRFLRIPQTCRVIKKIKPDLVHAHSAFGQGFFGAFSGFQPYIISCWGSDIRVIPNKSFLHKIAVKFALKRASMIHVQDKLSKKIIGELSPKYEKKTIVKAWGIDLKEFNPQNKDKEIREEHAINGGPIVVSVRNLTKKYDIETLFRAIPSIVRAIPHVKFVVLNDGYLKPYFQKIANETGVGKNIDFVGFVSFEQYKKYLASADLFIDTFYPRDNRGGQMFGQGLLEAMASGVTTAVANRPTIYEYKGKERWYFGYTFKGGDAKDLADKSIKLLSNQDEMDSIRKKNIESVRKWFDWNRNMGELEEILYKRWLE